MTTNVVLPPALEKFARDCVADGRYSNVSEVVRSNLTCTILRHFNVEIIDDLWRRGWDSNPQRPLVLLSLQRE